MGIVGCCATVVGFPKPLARLPSLTLRMLLSHQKQWSDLPPVAPIRRRPVALVSGYLAFGIFHVQTVPVNRFSQALFFGFCCWAAWLPALAVQGQVAADSVQALPVVLINAAQIRQQAIGSPGQQWSGADLDKRAAGHVADLLAAETGVYIKQYGPGTLATSSVRGAGAGHTLVLWNGLPIQSPMLGLLDLSLLPLSAVEALGFTRGGNSAMWGSGAIGGVLTLDNQPDFLKRIQLKSSTQAGSFGHFRQQISIGGGNKKIQSITRFSHQEADNDFVYFVAAGLPERRQTNAGLRQQYWLQDFYWKINKRSRLAMHYWRQSSQRQIPPTLVQTRSAAQQQDLSTRVMLDFEQLTEKIAWNSKAALFDEQLDYVDKQILLDSRSRFRTYLAETSLSWKGGARHRFLLGNTHSYTRAWSAGYQKNVPREYKTALFGAWKYAAGKIKTEFSLRQEWVDQKRTPPAPSFGMEYHITPAWLVMAKINRNYRLPTFNDRFWLPGGNASLRPESGWSEELTLTRQHKNKGFYVQTSLTAFNRNIDNWILWGIQKGQSFWSANNVTSVWSRGLESRISLQWTVYKIRVQLQGGYDYIRSTNQVAQENPAMPAGAQLIYTPVHQGFGRLAVEWRSILIDYQHTLTGKTQGINEAIAAFQLGNIRLQYSGQIKQIRTAIFVNLNNVWDADFIVVERRPMPGIHFQTGIQFFFHQI